MVRTGRSGGARLLLRRFARAVAATGIVGALALALPALSGVTPNLPLPSHTTHAAEGQPRLDRGAVPVRVRVPAIGIDPVEHEEKVLCCGKACMDPEIPGEMTRDILRSIKKLDVDCMGLICPTCFDEYDVAQIKLSRKFKEEFNLPVIYYFQLLGLAQGMDPAEMGFSRHKIMWRLFWRN